MQEAEAAATPPTAEKAALEANARQGQVGRRLEMLSFKIIKLYKKAINSHFSI